MTNNPVADLVANKITMTYRNYRGEVAARTITPLSIRWGVTDWHPTPGWLLTAFDHGKQADRDFALADCQFAALTPASAEPVEWRDISTAPRDGTRFIATDGDLAFKTYLAKHYVKWPHEEGGPTFRDVWQYVDSDSVVPWNPTLWTPIPGTSPHPAPVTVEAAAVDALSAYQQADMDGIMVLVSRQAIEECLPALRALSGEKS